MKKLYTTTLLALGIGSLGFAEETAQNIEMIAQAPSNGTNVKQDCSHLSREQQNFAMQLMNPASKAMFCSKFSMDQRKSAMQMTTTPGAGGTRMTADQAVEQVAKKNNMMMPPPNSEQSSPQTQQPTQPQQRRGGCPVRTQ